MDITVTETLKITVRASKLYINSVCLGTIAPLIKKGSIAIFGDIALSKDRLYIKGDTKKYPISSLGIIQALYAILSSNKSGTWEISFQDFIELKKSGKIIAKYRYDSSEYFIIRNGKEIWRIAETGVYHTSTLLKPLSESLVLTANGKESINFIPLTGRQSYILRLSYQRFIQETS